MDHFVPDKEFAKRTARAGGFSMAEALITVAVIGILSAVAISAFQNVREGAQLGVAREVVNNLNNSVADYSQINWGIDVAAQSDESDEMWILLSLQWRDSDNPPPGAPFMNPTWNPEVSSDSEDHRARWNGSAFELLLPGESGTGLRVNFEGGTDMGDYVTHPDGFYPVSPGSHTSAPTFD